jgi:hypothetical protein
MNEPIKSKEDEEQPATKRDLELALQNFATKKDLEVAVSRLERFVLDREAALIWKVIALQVTLIGAIAGAQWVALITLLQHWKP